MRVRNFFIFLFIALIFITPVVSVLADDINKQIDDLDKEIKQLMQGLEESRTQTNQNKVSLQTTQQKLLTIQEQIALIEQSISKKEKEVKLAEAGLQKQQDMLRVRVLSHYKSSGSQSTDVLALMLGANLSESLQDFFYQKNLIDKDRKAISAIIDYIENVRMKKESLNQDRSEFVTVKQQLNQQSFSLASLIEEAQQKEDEVEQRIVALSTKQQQLIAQKLASLNLPISVGNSGILGCTDDRQKDPGFSPAFAFFTFGIPHRVGMSQFGAYGRARAGQNYEAILNAYYNNVKLECKPFPNQKIRVTGYGEVDIYDYLRGLGEMPERWGNEGAYEALKAQAVAAASYAYSYTNGGEGEICTTQACQVYLGHSKGGKWEEAVNEIQSKCGDSGAQVLVSNDTGEVIKAWYASTFGGVALTSGEVWGSHKPWTKHFIDASSNSSNVSELSQIAYDRDSECFYSAHGWRPEANKTAWLRGEELADIVNVLLLAKRDPGTQIHLSQSDKPNPDGSDTWNADKVKGELRSRGGSPFNRIDSVTVNIDMHGGQTSSVQVNGDAGAQSFSGSDFKSFFNLRAPANLQIVGPMFNIERR